MGHLAPRGRIFRRFHGMNPKRESKRQWLMSNYIWMFGLYKYRYIIITNGSLNFHLDSRLGVMTHDIPWKRLKIRPLVKLAGVYWGSDKSHLKDHPLVVPGWMFHAISSLVLSSMSLRQL